MQLEFANRSLATVANLRSVQLEVWNRLVRLMRKHGFANADDAMRSYVDTLFNDGVMGAFTATATRFSFAINDDGSRPTSIRVVLHWLEVASAMDADAIDALLARNGLRWRRTTSLYELLQGPTLLVRSSDATWVIFERCAEARSVVARTDASTLKWSELDAPTQQAVGASLARGACSCGLCHAVHTDLITYRALPPNELAALDAWEARLQQGRATSNIEALFDALALPFEHVRHAAVRAVPPSVIREAPELVITRLSRMLASRDVRIAQRASATLAGFLEKVRAADKEQLAKLVLHAWAHPELDVARAACRCASHLRRAATAAHCRAWALLVERCLAFESSLIELTPFISQQPSNEWVIATLPGLVGSPFEAVRDSALFEVRVAGLSKRCAPLLEAVASVGLHRLPPGIVALLRSTHQDLPAAADA